MFTDDEPDVGEGGTLKQTTKFDFAPALSVIDARIIAVRYPQAEEEVQRRMFHGGRLFRIESGPLLSF
jgi:hypothetical protein